MKLSPFQLLSKALLSKKNLSSSNIFFSICSHDWMKILRQSRVYNTSFWPISSQSCFFSYGNMNCFVICCINMWEILVLQVPGFFFGAEIEEDQEDYEEEEQKALSHYSCPSSSSLLVENLCALASFNEHDLLYTTVWEDQGAEKYCWGDLEKRRRRTTKKSLKDLLKKRWRVARQARYTHDSFP